MLSLGVLLATIAVVLPVELPDKTLVATLILTTRFRPLPVLAGVSAAFFVQCAIAVTAGGLLGLLPHRVVAAVVAALFGVGAFLLLRGDDEGADAVAEEAANLGSWRIALTSFGVLFAAEWGDASQLASAALAARYDEPLSVFLGAWLALVAVAALAVVLGRQVQRRVPLHLVQRVAGCVFLVFAAVAVVEAVRG